ncbi:MAG: hypothetical protein C0425_00820 [Chlorobiaceae bacterium]|nr:hypothetical protein [Chlorobiaceae bacterium]MBA4308864.1 hypothetical protein [Chlorobiaceae bacterium]
MKKVYFLPIVLVAMYLTFTGYQCASTELTSAKLYIQQKNLVKAEEVLLKEITNNPRSDEGFYLLGYVHGENQKIEKMIDAFDKSLAISKRFAQDIQRSKTFYWANYFNEGVNFFNRATQAQDPDTSKIFYEKSAVAFTLATKIEPDSVDAFKNLAFVNMNMGKYEEAIPPLQKLIDLKKALDGYKFIGEIYYNKGATAQMQFEETKNVADSITAQGYFLKAVAILEEGRKYHKDDPDLLLFLSNSYIATNKMDVALEAFREGVAREPGNKNYRYNYGVVLLNNNQFGEAAEQFKKALEIDSEYLNAIYNIAVTYVKWGAHIQKEFDEANKDRKEFVENVASKEKYRLALPHLEKFVQLKSDDAVIWDLLGRVYSVLGMLDDAKNAFEKADKIRK